MKHSTITLHKNKIIALFTAIVVLVSGYFVLHSRATGFFAATEPENGSRTTNAKLVTDAGASGGKAVQFTAASTTPPPTDPPTTPPPSGSSWPDASTTGVQAGVTLTPYNGHYFVYNDGAVIENLDISGALVINADNVTVRNVRVRGIGSTDACITQDRNNHGLRADHIEVGDDTFRGVAGIVIAAKSSGYYTDPNTNIIDHANIHHVFTGLIPDSGVTLRNSYIHDLPGQGDSSIHSGGIHFMNRGYTLLEHNRIDSGSTANIFSEVLDGIQPSHITINNNYLPGTTFFDENGNGYGGYIIFAFGDSATIVVSNNVFEHRNSTTNKNDPANSAADGGLNWTSSTWFGNKYSDGATVPIP